jgi:hypothetical protein
MSASIQAPVEMVEAVAALRLPAKADRYLQTLMDRNTDGHLTPQEREGFEAIVELSETISLLRSQALSLLARNHGGSRSPGNSPTIPYTLRPCAWAGNTVNRSGPPQSEK